MFRAYVNASALFFSFVILVTINGVTLTLPGISRCGRYLPGKLIAGGNNTSKGEFPWMAVLVYEGHNDYKCAGTLINERYILTAAHCLQDDVVAVRLGVHQLSNYSDTLTVTVEGKPIIHFGYNTTDVNNMTNDIGLLRLSKKVRYTRFIKPICLPSTDGLDTAKEDGFYELAGWGSNGTNTYVDTMQRLSVNVTNFGACRDKYETYLDRHLSESQLCAAENNRAGTCTGDSGSPLMTIVARIGYPQIKRYKIEGITSIGAKQEVCAAGNWPGVFTKVSSFDEWIRDNIRS